MNWFPRVAIGLVVLAFLGIAAANITWAVRHDDDDRRTVEYRIETPDGQPVEGGGPIVVVTDDHHGRGGRPFFPLFPLIPVAFFALILLLVWRRPWGGPHDGFRGRFDEWHRNAHAGDGSAG